MEIKNYDFLQKLQNLSFIDEIWLFGSRIRGDNQPRADIDLAISCKNANFDEWSEILNIIEEADTLLKIDCIRLDKLAETSKIKENILKEGEKIYEKC